MNIPIWTGTSTFSPGQTPFGFYDTDIDFIKDADKVSDFCARRLGYPLTEVELQSGSFMETNYMLIKLEKIIYH